MNGKKIDYKKAGSDHIWYPFTQMREHVKEELVVIDRADGSYLIDIDGKRYIDGVCSLWTNVHGHRHPKLDAALRAQLDKVAHSTLLGLSNTAAIECAAKLAMITPKGLTKIFFSDNGSTGVEVALKMAYQYHLHKGKGSTGRTKFVALKNAYHGDTIGAVSVGGVDLFHGAFRPLLFEALHAESPYCYRCPLGKSAATCGLECADDIERLLKKHGDEVIALIMEPLVQAAGGMIVHPEGYLRKVRKLCDSYGVLMILDEVATGFGKTGKMFACEHENVIPDIMVIAKGITGGYLPLAATVTNEEIYGAFLGRYDEFKTFFHGHTFTGNPLACALAVANMELFETEDVLSHVNLIADRMGRNLEKTAALAHVGEVRRRGVMTGIELVIDKSTREPYHVAQRIGHAVTLAARKKGLIIRPLGNVMVLMPPLSLSIAECDKMCTIIHDSIIEATE
jgi:adenosylmethionine-8-amino-7-oxononanoate aminotransferase